MVLAQELQQIISSKLKNRPKLSIKTKQNLLINTVTALEVFFKDLIIEFKGKWNDQGLDKLLTGNSIPLNLAFNLFRGKTLKKEHLIVHYFSFQSLHTCDNVFSNLLGTTKFLEDLGDFEYGVVPDNNVSKMNAEYKDWKKELVSLFELRHRIIHEGSNEIIKNRDFRTFAQLAIHLPSVLESYVKTKLSIPVKDLVFYNFGK